MKTIEEVREWLKEGMIQEQDTRERPGLSIQGYDALARCVVYAHILALLENDPESEIEKEWRALERLQKAKGDHIADYLKKTKL